MTDVCREFVACFTCHRVENRVRRRARSRSTPRMGSGRWGGVGMMTLTCTCTHGRCYASHGVGWGGHDDVPCTCNFDLARMVDATQQMGWWGGRMRSIAEISDCSGTLWNVLFALADP